MRNNSYFEQEFQQFWSEKKHSELYSPTFRSKLHMKDVKEVKTFEMLSDKVVSGTQELGSLGLCCVSV